MQTFRAPQEIFDSFIGADEKKHLELRKAVARWLARISFRLRHGDVVIIPDPKTGREKSWTFRDLDDDI